MTTSFDDTTPNDSDDSVLLDGDSFTRKDVNEVCKRLNITANGYEGAPGIHSTQDVEFYRQVGVALAWLRQAEFTQKTFTTGSYSAKHTCEKLAHTYVSNGALIVAVNLLAIPHKKHPPNATLPLATRWYKQQSKLAYEQR